MRADAKKRELTITFILLLVGPSAFIIDVGLIPGAVLPSVTYAIPILIAAYLLPPRFVAGIGGSTVLLRFVAMWVHQTPWWLACLYVLSLVLIAYLGFALSKKNRNEAALADQRLALLTDLQRSEAEIANQRNQIKSSEARLRAVLDNTTAMVYLRDLDGRFTLVNRQYQRIFKLSEDQILGRTIFDIMPKGPAAIIHANDKKIIEGGMPLQFEEVVPRGDGPHVYLSLKFPVLDTDGRIISLGGISSDITDQRKRDAERESLLAEVERRAAEMDAMITSMADAVVIYGPSEQMVFMNPAAEKMLGYTLEERARSLEERMALQRLDDADGKPFPIEAIPGRRALRGETVHGVVMVLHPPRSNRAVWVTNSAAPIVTTDGKLQGAVSIFTDVTMIQELLNQREDLLRTTSHDLRNPLAVIMGQSQLLERMIVKAGLSGSELRSVETITANARRMNTIIEDLVDAMRLAAGELRIEKRELELRPFLEELLKRSEGAIQSSRIKLNLPATLPAVLADPSQLERIFLNLFTNALKYSAVGTDVVVKGEKRDSEIVISVSDQGYGISSTDLPLVFEKYFRADTGREAEGVGLGLYITRMMIQAHDGQIWVESKPGRGSTFYFTLQMAKSLSSVTSTID